jgi:hypothetical protein
MAPRQLLLLLAPGQPDARGVHHDDVITRVHVWSEDRLVLAANDGRHLRRQAAQDYAAGIDQIPAAFDVARPRRVGLHT